MIDNSKKQMKRCQNDIIRENIILKDLILLEIEKEEK
jgi:hypothetical protein